MSERMGGRTDGLPRVPCANPHCDCHNDDRPYQVEGAKWLAERGVAYLAFQPGLGKTRTVLRALQLAGIGDAGVVCPAIVRTYWREQGAEFGLNLRVESYEGVTLNVVTRERVMGSWTDLGPRALILDEAHMLANWSAQRTRVVLGSVNGMYARTRRTEWPVIGRVDATSAPSPEPDARFRTRKGRVWFVSGTPMPRNPGQLYPVLYATGLYSGNYQSFIDTYCEYKTTKFGVKITGHKNLGALKSLLKASRNASENPFMFRLRAEWVAKDLPPLRWGVIPLDVDDLSGLDALDPRVLGALKNGTLPPMDPNLARFMHQVGDLKAPAAVKLLENELESDPSCKRVVFAYHRSVIDTLRRGLARFGMVHIDGDTPEWRREDAKQTFRHEASCRVFIGQINACGVGLDGLQYAAREAVMVEPVWKSDANVQAAHRLARLGQVYPVQVRMLSLANTPDRWVIAQHHREVKLVSEVIDT